MSNPTPVITTIETVLDNIAPFVPMLAQKIPAKVRTGLYIGLPIAGALFDALAPQLGIRGTVVALVDVADSLILGAVAVGNTPRPPKRTKRTKP